LAGAGHAGSRRMLARTCTSGARDMRVTQQLLPAARMIRGTRPAGRWTRRDGRARLDAIISSPATRGHGIGDGSRADSRGTQNAGSSVQADVERVGDLDSALVEQARAGSGAAAA